MVDEANGGKDKMAGSFPEVPNSSTCSPMCTKRTDVSFLAKTRYEINVFASNYEVAGLGGGGGWGRAVELPLVSSRTRTVS